VKLGLSVLALSSVAALVPVAQGATSGPETTAPPPIVTIKVNITDNRITMVPKRAQRGVMARFVLVNTGKQAHTFKLGHERRGTATQTGFAVPVKAAEQSVKIYYLDYRGKLPYLGSNKADLSKPGMKGIFTIF
jgi:hypothetical protein